jgi:2-polyprenyl-3-methyl-5-hydroxy-6-metoxy-1,4-benzoquinol methylase
MRQAKIVGFFPSRCARRHGGAEVALLRSGSGAAPQGSRGTRAGQPALKLRRFVGSRRSRSRPGDAELAAVQQGCRRGDIIAISAAAQGSGGIFLDWIAPRPGLRWVDVGCGNGAFTELVVERCAPAEVHGIDPSEGQLKYARARPGTRMAEFRQGDAMALPFPGNSFDLAVMALVIFFVPDPAKGGFQIPPKA